MCLYVIVFWALLLKDDSQAGWTCVIDIVLSDCIHLPHPDSSVCKGVDAVAGQVCTSLIKSCLYAPTLKYTWCIWAIVSL